MTIQDPPKVENEYLKMSSDEITKTLGNLKAALESKTDINAAELLGLKMPEVSKNEAPKMTTEEVERLQSVIKFANDKLAEAGVSIDAPVVSKMSEVEKQLAEKQEKMATAKFGEQLTDLKILDANLDTDLIKTLNMSTEDKVAVASVVKSYATTYNGAIAKLSKELESANAQAASLAKFQAPVPEMEDGAQLVAKFSAQHGLSTEEKTN